MSEEKKSKQYFKPDLGFIGTGAIAGAALGSYPCLPTIGFALALPQLGGKTNDQKASLFIGEVIGFVAVHTLPTLASNFIQKNPGTSLLLGAAAGTYYYKDDICAYGERKVHELANELYESTIGSFWKNVSPNEVSGETHVDPQE